MAIAQPIDDRNFFILPQGYEGGGYYTYGTPSEGKGQFAHPRMISLIQQVAFRWCAVDSRNFGVGNISLANGREFEPHSTHRSGLEVDIRLIRLDGYRMPCTFRDHVYDREATARLIEIFRRVADVKAIYFNDVQIRGVERAKSHDNHFHVAIN